MEEASPRRKHSVKETTSAMPCLPKNKMAFEPNDSELHVADQMREPGRHRPESISNSENSHG